MINVLVGIPTCRTLLVSVQRSSQLMEVIFHVNVHHFQVHPYKNYSCCSNH